MKLHLWLIRLPGVLVPRALRADWQREWESELRFREHQLAEWDRLEAVRRAALAIDPALPIDNLRTLAEQRDGSLYTNRAVAWMLSLFAALALMVAAVGLYGVLSYAVTERTREMGIRLAHGAQPIDLLRLIVGHGVILTVFGLAAGLAGAFAVTRVTRGFLFGVSPTDPWTFVTIPFVLLAVAVLASAVPAWRATRLDPMMSLRSE